MLELYHVMKQQVPAENELRIAEINIKVLVFSHL